MSNTDEDVNTPVEAETTDTESSPVEEQTTEAEQQVEEVQETQEQSSETQEASEDTTDEGSSRKRNAQSRIRELLEENKRLQGQQPTQSQQSPQTGKFSDLVKGKTEVTPEDLDRLAEQYVAQTANTLVDLRLSPIEQKLKMQELQGDISQVQTKYEELNPESDNYNPNLDKRIAEMYRRNGAGVPLSQFVQEQMDLVNEVATKKTVQTQETLQQQQDDAALRPGTPRQETKFEDLSEKEMEEKLGIVR